MSSSSSSCLGYTLGSNSVTVPFGKLAYFQTIVFQVAPTGGGSCPLYMALSADTWPFLVLDGSTSPAQVRLCNWDSSTNSSVCTGAPLGTFTLQPNQINTFWAVYYGDTPETFVVGTGSVLMMNIIASTNAVVGGQNWVLGQGDPTWVPTQIQATCPTTTVQFDQTQDLALQCLTVQACNPSVNCVPCSSFNVPASLANDNFCMSPNPVPQSFYGPTLVPFQAMQAAYGGTLMLQQNPNACSADGGQGMWTMGLDTQPCTSCGDPYCKNAFAEPSVCGSFCCSQRALCVTCEQGDSPATINAKCFASLCDSGGSVNACLPCASPYLPISDPKNTLGQGVTYTCTLGRVTVTVSNQTAQGGAYWFILDQDDNPVLQSSNGSNPVSGVVTANASSVIVLSSGQGLYFSDILIGSDQGTRSLYIDLCPVYFPWSVFLEPTGSITITGQAVPRNTTTAAAAGNGMAYQQQQQQQQQQQGEAATASWQYGKRYMPVPFNQSTVPFDACPIGVTITYSANIAGTADASAMPGNISCNYAQTASASRRGIVPGCGSGTTPVITKAT